MLHAITIHSMPRAPTRPCDCATLRTWVFDEVLVNPQDTPDLGGHHGQRSASPGRTGRMDLSSMPGRR